MVILLFKKSVQYMSGIYLDILMINFEIRYMLIFHTSLSLNKNCFSPLKGVI